MPSVHDVVTSVKGIAGFGDKNNTDSNIDSTAETGGTTTQASDPGTIDRTADSTTGTGTGATGTTDTTTGTTDSLTDRTVNTTGSAADTTDTTGTTGTTDSTTDRAADTTATDSEPTTTESAPEPTERRQDDADTSGSDIQNADPNLVGPGEAGTGKVKMTGTGTPGSHSALFGLTPDGHKETESSTITTAPQPSEQDAKAQPKEAEGEDTGSRAPEGNEKTAEQLDDPRVAEKGHDGNAVEDEGTGKPGSGT